MPWNTFWWTETLRLVVRGHVVGDRADLAEKLIGTPRRHRSRSGSQRRVVEVAAVQVQRVRSDVLDVERRRLRNLALNAEAPLVHRRRRQVPVVRDPVGGG